ncbi:hypothetical protein K503DRAFT_686825 [Rhizopogon vinicolor AM-OR11-026]|uniref:Uncharacterized protein n=1 Tax=Rhizopogon vinicolor AM-OR11-026 TaxID=1314800 RepID=A0A1B7N7H8_9AGAM|nr:hypothetical protein K503DRAFT_686825 [Rhizopogon vinicolor AM-OR11-026]
MISTMCPDIDHADEYICNTTACAFSVVASALGIPSLLPFLKAIYFDEVLKPLWLGICLHHRKGLIAFLKAIGFIISLMDPEYASYYAGGFYKLDWSYW